MIKFDDHIFSNGLKPPTSHASVEKLRDTLNGNDCVGDNYGSTCPPSPIVMAVENHPE